jgi:hypothetical protein
MYNINKYTVNKISQGIDIELYTPNNKIKYNNPKPKPKSKLNINKKEKKK